MADAYTQPLSDVVRGAIAGVTGTTLMSEILAFAERSGASGGALPQKEIAENLEEKVGLDDLPEPVEELSWISQHFAYGTLAGVVYSLVQGRLKLSSFPLALVSGGVFGLALYGVGLAGWAPAARLYPPPSEQSGRRIATDVAAHLVYGGVTAMMHWMLRSRPAR
jgi:hypothetical protein